LQALIIQHVLCEGPGLLYPALSAAGWELDLRVMSEGGVVLPNSLEGYQALIILGGPMGAYEEERYPYLYQVENLIRDAYAQKIPTLGICLGAQIIARAMGAWVGPNTVKEIGWSKVYLTPEGKDFWLFEGLPKELWVFQWHGDTFALPSGATLLAEGVDCKNQAFLLGDSLLALQFHLEVTPEMVDEWCRVYRDELVEFGGPGFAEKLSEETKRRFEEDRKIRERFLENLLLFLVKGK
jgi:GMP synthase-like glutamine amidotransferase